MLSLQLPVIFLARFSLIMDLSILFSGWPEKVTRHVTSLQPQWPLVVSCLFVGYSIRSTGAAYIHSFFPSFRVALSIQSTTMVITEFLSSVSSWRMFRQLELMFGYERGEVYISYKVNLANVNHTGRLTMG